jgi:hypothetical protein
MTLSKYLGDDTDVELHDDGRMVISHMPQMQPGARVSLSPSTVRALIAFLRDANERGFRAADAPKPG